MAKEQAIVQDGVVFLVLPDTMFRVRLENDHEVLAYASGKMKRHNIKILCGDKVRLEISPYDLNRGRVVFRYK